MASSQTPFSDQKYLNWLSGTLSLLYVKEGIEIIVDEEVTRFHRHIQQRLGLLNAAPQICFSCTSRNITQDFRCRMWHMPCSLCNPWLQEIVKHHSNYNAKKQPLPKLCPKNTDPQCWPTVPFQVIKAYMPFGCQDNQSAKDGDAQGIFSLIKNCSHFDSSKRIGRLDLIDDLIQFRNSLFHSGNFLTDDTDLQAAQQTMLDFLGGCTSLSPPEQQSVDQAINKITELQKGKVDLSLNRELHLRALQLKQNALDSDLKCVQHDLDTTKAKANSTEDAVNTIKTDLRISNTQVAEVNCDMQTLQKDVALVSAKSSTTEIDLKTLTGTVSKHEQKLQKLQDLRDSFNKFLAVNDLQQDLKRLSTAMDNNSQRIHSLETQSQERDIASQQHKRKIKTLYRRHQRTFNKKLKTHHVRLKTVEKKLHSQAGNETKDITDKDITALPALLRKYYRTMCLTIPNPLVSEELGLDRVYVDPDIKVLRETADPGSGLVDVQTFLPTPSDVSQCRQLFYTNDYKCKHIYVSGDAGLGKSVFCKHLVDLWCKAGNDNAVNGDNKECNFDASSFLSKHQEGSVTKKHEANRRRMELEDRRIMSEFKLVFYIKLRESPNQYHVADMIDSQLLQEIEETQHLRASVLLRKVRCLVIIDGLDEWVCPNDAKIIRNMNPGIPGRYLLNEDNVFLTTTRPWKFDVLQLTSKEVDKDVKLLGFNKTSAHELHFKLIKLMKRPEHGGIKEGKFQAELQKKGLSHLCEIPVILTQLICLWSDNQDLGSSQVDTYCSILEMLLKRAVKNLPEEIRKSTPEATHREMLLPSCFLNRKHCQAHHKLLLSLCNVAFRALFNLEREHSLVFDNSQMELYGVDQFSIDLCLKSGILSQSKVLGKWSLNEKNMSFIHKKLQEFLAATFIAKCTNAESVISYVKPFCTTVETLLEMSQVWMFVSGIRPDLAKQLLPDLMAYVLKKDIRLQEYRHNLTGDHRFVESIQTCIVDCVVEARNNGHRDFCLPLEDYYFIDNMCACFESLESLLVFNKTNIKSVVIGRKVPFETAKRVMLQVQDTRCLHKFSTDNRHLCITNTEFMCHTLTCLSLSSMTLNTVVSTAVCNALNHITAFKIYDIKLTYKQLEQLLASVSQARTIKVLFLSDMQHTPHCITSIDLSCHTKIETLILYHMNVCLPMVTKCVKYVSLWYGTISDTHLRQFIHKVSTTSHEVAIELYDVTVTGDSAKPVDLSDLKHSKFVVTHCCHHDRYNTWSIKLKNTRTSA